MSIKLMDFLLLSPLNKRPAKALVPPWVQLLKYDFLRLLYARARMPIVTIQERKWSAILTNKLNLWLLKISQETHHYLAPVIRARKDIWRIVPTNRKGFKSRVNGHVLDITAGMKLDRYKTHDIELWIVWWSKIHLIMKSGWASINTAMHHGENVLMLDQDSKEYVTLVETWCVTSGISYQNPEPNLFSFNSQKSLWSLQRTGDGKRNKY
jgi:excinuclease ABC subunit A